ncbi:MAG: hypothetical protein E6Z70_09905, partial [Cutibacterium avidum]|nr:hypothetical protein [Cutibacterium avidum]
PDPAPVPEWIGHTFPECPGHPDSQSCRQRSERCTHPCSRQHCRYWRFHRRGAPSCRPAPDRSVIDD